MTGWALFITVALAHQLAIMSPGPDVAVITQQTLRHGRRAGIWVAAGIATGITVHLSYGLFGLGWITAHLPGLLEGLRFAGGTVLLWMGITALRHVPVSKPAAIAVTTPSGALPRFASGLATNLFNPKAAFFFVALFTSVLSHSTSTGLRLTLAAWVIATTFAWFALVAYFLTTPIIQHRLHHHALLIQRGMGLLLMALGIGMLWSGLQLLPSAP